MFVRSPELLTLLTTVLFDSMIVLLVQELKEAAGGGGIIQWLRGSDGVIVDVDGELMGEISLGDKESMLSTPLSASDIAAGVLEMCCDDEKLDLLDVRMLP